jgi:hypothetical protein
MSELQELVDQAMTDTPRPVAIGAHHAPERRGPHHRTPPDRTNPHQRRVLRQSAHVADHPYKCRSGTPPHHPRCHASWPYVLSTPPGTSFHGRFAQVVDHPYKCPCGIPEDSRALVSGHARVNTKPYVTPQRPVRLRVHTVVPRDQLHDHPHNPSKVKSAGYAGATPGPHAELASALALTRSPRHRACGYPGSTANRPNSPAPTWAPGSWAWASWPPSATSPRTGRRSPTSRSPLNSSRR